MALTGCISKPEKRALAEEYYNLGNAHLQSGSFDRAVELFTRAVETDPDLLQAYHNLSLALVRAGRGDEAIANLTTVLASDPTNTSLLSILAYSHYQQGDLEQALEGYLSVLALNPGARDVQYNTAMIQWQLERHEEAAGTFQDIISQQNEDKEFTDSLYNLGVLSLEQKDAATASDYLARYLEWVPNDTEAHLLLASAYRDIEQYLDALQTYDALLLGDDAEVEAWFGKAEILLTTVEDPVAGLKALREALKLGFAEVERLQALVDNPLILERDRVRATIQEWDLLPEDA